jgi:DNA (cytosine-5)-methyltransferase 1
MQGRGAVSTAEAAHGDGTEPVRLTITEALILQSFRPDYPLQGSRTAQFRQVGDAVPPLLAAHVLSAVTGQALEVAA